MKTAGRVKQITWDRTLQYYTARFKTFAPKFQKESKPLSQKAASQSCPLFLWQLDLPFPFCYTFWIQFSLLLPINQHTLTALFGIKQAHMFLQLLPMWEDNTLKVNQAICWQNWALGSAQAGWWEAAGVWFQMLSRCSMPKSSRNVTLHNHPLTARFMLCFEYFWYSGVWVPESSICQAQSLPRLPWSEIIHKPIWAQAIIYSIQTTKSRCDFSLFALNVN